MKKRKHTINVYKMGKFIRPQEEDFVHVIKKVMRTEIMGNFCPVYCKYKGKEYLVKSKAGDLSDPFRADESYLKELYIVID